MSNSSALKWYHKDFGIILLLVFFFPVGLYLMWKHANWPINAKKIITGFFALFVIISIFFNEPTESPTLENTETETVEVTTAPTPEETEVMEETLVESSAQAEYFAQVIKISDTHSTALIKLSDILINKPTELFYDNDTRLEAALYIAVIRNSYEEAQKLTPPEELKEIHSNFEMGLLKHQQSMDLLVKGIDQVDTDLLVEAKEVMDEGTQYINKATDLIQAMAESKQL